jgi:hypothetical protein
MAAAPAAQHLASTADAGMRARHADSGQAGRPHAESQEHALARQFFPDEFEDAEDHAGEAVPARQQQETAAQRSTTATTRRHACSGVHVETVHGLAVSTLTHRLETCGILACCWMLTWYSSFHLRAVSPGRWCG